MAWLARLVTWAAAPTIERLVQVRLAEASPAQGQIDADDALYRRLTQQSQRDLAPTTHARMLEISHYLARQNPFAKWILDTTRDFVCGEGVTITAADPIIQDAIGAFWSDPINRMDEKWPEKVRELGVFGEACWPVFVNEQTGLLRLATVDPSRIDAVIHDPDNAEEPIGVVLKATIEHKGKKLRIIKQGPDETMFSAAAYQLRQEEFVDGDCFYYTINKAASIETRGISDLFALADWLDGYEQTLWNTLERTGFLNAFCWDVTLEGMQEGDIVNWKNANPPPKAGSLFVHNEKVHLAAVAPNLQSEDTERHARLFRNQILGASGLPEHWYGGGGDVNRATAAEMAAPTFKRLQYRQRHVKMILEDIVRVQLREAGERQPGVARADQTFQVVFPRLDTANTATTATALRQLTDALAIATERGWADEGHAKALFTTMAALLGVGNSTE